MNLSFCFVSLKVVVNKSFLCFPFLKKDFEIIEKLCFNCGKECSRKHNKFCSTECYREYEKKENKMPKVPELLESFKVNKNFVKVGLSFGVSDNTVRKWCLNYGIMDMIK